MLQTEYGVAHDHPDAISSSVIAFFLYFDEIYSSFLRLID